MSEKGKYYMISLICGIQETEEMNKHSQQKQSHRQRKNRWLPEGGMGGE